MSVPPEILEAAVNGLAENCHNGGREKERTAIVHFIRDRGDQALSLSRRGRFDAAEGQRLKRWLYALADDIEQRLHVGEPEEPDGDRPAD